MKKQHALKSFRWAAWTVLTAALATMVGAASPRNLPKAIDTQMELHRQHPEDPKVANDLGNLLILAERPEEAETAYQRAIELAPGDSVPRYNLALLQQRQGRMKAALGTFRSVIELDPSNSWAHYQVGALYEAMGEKPRAIAAYSRAFALNPELASSEVNPQVIDSKWVVEAMLKGYREATAQTLAPQAYDDPNRIAMLMISSPDAPIGVGEEQMAEGEPETDEAQPDGGRAAQSRFGTGEESPRSGSPERSGTSEPVAAVPGSRRVLTTDSIDKGSTLGQVGPAGVGSSSSRRTTATRRPSSTYVPPSRRTNNSSAPNVNPSGRSLSRQRYQPSTRSTGSLDMELVPGPDPVVPAG